MRYPYRNFIFYLILLQCDPSDTRAYLEDELGLPFDKSDYADLKKELVTLYPEAKKALKRKTFTLEPWMEDLGLQVFQDKSFSDVADQVEDLLQNIEIRNIVDTLIYFQDPPEKILRKIAPKAAVAYTIDCIIAYRVLFYNTELMSLLDWRVFTRYRASKGYADPTPYQMSQNNPAHQIEAELGVEPEMEPVTILKEGAAKLYREWIHQMDIDPAGANAARLYKMMMSTVKMIDERQDADTTALAKKIGENHRRVKRDQYIADQTLPLFEENTYGPAEPPAAKE